MRALLAPDEAARTAAIEAIRQLGADVTVEPLSEAVGTWTAGEQASARLVALEALAETKHVSAPLRLVYLLMAREGELELADREFLRRLVEATQEHDGGARTVAYLMSMLGIGPRDGRVITMLAWLAPDSVDPLVEALGDPSKGRQAALALGYLRDPRAVEPLRAVMLEGYDQAGRRAAAWALGSIGDPGAADALLHSEPDDSQTAPAPEAADPAPAGPILDEPPAFSRDSLAALDFEGLAELYEIALDAWRSAHRNADFDQEERWRAITAAVVDEAHGRPADERVSGSQGQGSRLNRRRRERQVADLRAACAERDRRAAE